MKSRGKTILIPRVCKSLLGWHTNSNSSFPSSESRVSSPYFCILEIIRKGAVHLASFQFYNHLIEEIKGHWLQQSSYGPEHHCECRDVCVCASCASSTTAHRCAPVNELHHVKSKVIHWRLLWALSTFQLHKGANSTLTVMHVCLFLCQALD